MPLQSAGASSSVPQSGVPVHGTPTPDVPIGVPPTTGAGINCAETFMAARAAADIAYNKAWAACASSPDPPTCRYAAFVTWQNAYTAAVQDYLACLSNQGLVTP